MNWILYKWGMFQAEVQEVQLLKELDLPYFDFTPVGLQNLKLVLQEIAQS